MAGQAIVRAEISAITNTAKCMVTTSSAHGFSTNNHIRFTDLGNVGPEIADRGFSQLNNNSYIAEVLSSTTFLIKDELTREYVDSTAFGAYVSGGTVTAEQQIFEYEAD